MMIIYYYNSLYYIHVLPSLITLLQISNDIIYHTRSMNNDKARKQRVENNRKSCVNRVLNSAPLQRQIPSGTASCYNSTSELLVFCVHSYVNIYTYTCMYLQSQSQLQQ